jgi:hypothetical protein
VLSRPDDSEDSDSPPLRDSHSGQSGNSSDRYDGKQ